MDCALTIAGSDSGGGAGIQADIKTFEAHKVFGLSAITALTAQNTVGVSAVYPIPPSFVVQQLRSVFEDFDIKGIKTGMLANAEIIHQVAGFLSSYPIPLIVDPVMISTSGDRLLAEDAMDALTQVLLPIASVITPNIDEAILLSGINIQSWGDVNAAAAILHSKWPQACIVLKGGHLSENPIQKRVRDLVIYQGHTEVLESIFHTDLHTHGTGCTFSAAITAGIASGLDILTAVRNAKLYIEKAIAQAPRNIGKGASPLLHNWK
jgi:hydroxymethylpyrimidine/phosphomethylpyrimidine kinase